MAAWPEIVFIDGKYKLLAQDFTLMLLLVEDYNGLSEIVSVSLIVHEDMETFRTVLKGFKNENLEACTKINSFMADKDLLGRDLLKKIFKVPVYICLFHTLKILRSQITLERMGPTAKIARDEVLNMLQTLAYSPSEDAYAATYKEFSCKAPKKVLEYYNQNWHPINDEWTNFGMTCGNFNNRTNNRLESINNKIKQVVHKRSTLVSFIDNFFEWFEW